MKYDFDTVFDRKNKNSLKYMAHPRYRDYDVIPLWVADMDFQTVPEVIDALQCVTQHGIFGYTVLDDEYFELLISWYKRRFSFNINREWIVPVNSVMSAISLSIRALTSEMDSVLIFQPVYYPFESVVINNKRTPVICELSYSGEKYTIDFNDFEDKIVKNNVKALLFCSPHNPVGRVWDKKELERVGKICTKHNVFIISDEIHSDLAYKNHLPFAMLSSEISERTVLCTSFTKTFNLAGIHGANVIIPNTDIRKAFENEAKAVFANGLGIMSTSAAKAVYRYGEKWLEELLEYLKDNISYVINSLKNTKIKPLCPEGTYLMWLDCRRLGLSDRELEKFFITRCGVWLNNGITFGRGGSGFMRMNIACPRATLEKAIKQILKELQ